jgi:hypothetical protein
MLQSTERAVAGKKGMLAPRGDSRDAGSKRTLPMLVPYYKKWLMLMAQRMASSPLLQLSFSLSIRTSDN